MEDPAKALSEIQALSDSINSRNEPFRKEGEMLEATMKDAFKRMRQEHRAEQERLTQRQQSAEASLRESFKNRSDCLKQRREAAVGEDEKRLEELQKSLSESPIEAAVTLLPPDIRPEIITVREQGDRIVLVRSPHAPELAFMVFAVRHTSTQWQMRLATDLVQRRYSVCCSCCPIGTYGFDRPEGDAEDRESWTTAKQTELQDLLVEACRKNGIKTVFMRRHGCWAEKIHEPKIVEADQYCDFVRGAYDEHIASKAVAFYKGL